METDLARKRNNRECFNWAGLILFDFGVLTDLDGGGAWGLSCDGLVISLFCT